MKYIKLKPSIQFQLLVDSYFFWQNDNFADPEIEIESPPNGLNALVFNYGDRYRVFQGGRIFDPAQYFIAGQATSSYRLLLSNRIAMAGIVFKPTALRKLIGIAASKFTDQRIDLSAILPETNLKRVLESLYLSTSIAEKYTILERFLYELISSKKITDNYVDQAYHIIKASKGNIKIDNLSKMLSVCPRHFRRTFYREVGVSPKEYIRIIRLGQVCYHLINQNDINWHDVIYQCGYFDQSHFIKDFIKFIGRKPSEYYRQNKELNNLISR